MANLFFGKMNSPEQIAEKIYRTNDKGFLGDIQIGDYAFIKLEKETSPASVMRLWKLMKFTEENGRYSAYFDEIINFTPINLLDFEALNLFVLDMNLLNKCNKQTKGLSFYKITLTDDSVFENLVVSGSLKDYLSKKENYRKFVKIKNKDLIDEDSINVQFYKDGDSWMLADAPFISSELKNKYDPIKFNKYDESGRKDINTAKNKMYNFLAGNDETDAPMMGLWDLFCGSRDVSAKTANNKMNSKIREDFIQFCKENDVVGAAKQYENGIRAIEEELDVNIDLEFDNDKCYHLLTKLNEHIDNFNKQELGNRRNWSSYVNKYVKFREYVLTNQDETLENGTIYKSTTSSDLQQTQHNGINKIFYGTPGCGKSYYVENVVLQNEKIKKCFRTTFYQDYTNTDFIGQVLPKINNDKTVTYEFNPGPFTLALKYSLSHKNENVALIIEELNRGNAPSIFGDIFQLLDREQGKSRYEIVNVNIQDYLKKEISYKLEYIKIPANLYILATMNTSDQNVFTLDTAFKRRWKFEKLTNKFNDDAIGKKYVPGLQNITWKTFVETINKHIVNNATSLSAEDKQLGKYFIDEELLMNVQDNSQDKKIKEFAYKIFEYLWTDVAKFNRPDWFIKEVNSLDILIDRYIHGKTIFVDDLAIKFSNGDSITEDDNDKTEEE